MSSAGRSDRLPADIRRFNDRLRDLLSEPYAIVDRLGRIVSANRPFCECFSLSPEVVQGMDMYDLPGWAERRDALDQLLRAVLDRHDRVPRVFDPSEMGALAPGTSGGLRSLRFANGMRLLAGKVHDGMVGLVLRNLSRPALIEDVREDAADRAMEIRHAFSITRSLVALVAAEEADGDVLRRAVLRRINALIGVFDLSRLDTDGMRVCALDDVIAVVLRALEIGHGKVEVNGPRVEVALEPALPLALVLQDLTRLYLDQDGGEVEEGIWIDWEFFDAGEETRRLRIDLRGPFALAEADRRSASLRLAEALSRGSLDGSIRLLLEGPHLRTVFDVTLPDQA
ncbi:MAG: PAS domain-containing protein [Pseudomonadota bacterium]